MEILFTKLADQPVLFLFLLIGVGMAFGHIKIKGIGLGAAAVLFLAIILSAWAETYGIHLRVTREPFTAYPQPPAKLSAACGEWTPHSSRAPSPGR